MKTHWNIRFTTRLFAVAACVVATLSFGCQTSSHKSVRMYDYNNEPQRSRASQPEETERVEDDGDWHMVEPGEMIVDPK